MTEKTRVTLAIFGLGCGGGGASTVERALARSPGVLWAYVNQGTEMAYVEFDVTRTSLDHVVHVIEETGFRVGDLNIR